LYTVGTVICYSNFSGTEAGWLLPVGISRTQLLTAVSIRNAMGAWWWVPPYDVVNATMGGGITISSLNLSSLFLLLSNFF